MTRSPLLPLCLLAAVGCAHARQRGALLPPPQLEFVLPAVASNADGVSVECALRLGEGARVSAQMRISNTGPRRMVILPDQAARPILMPWADDSIWGMVQGLFPAHDVNRAIPLDSTTTIPEGQTGVVSTWFQLEDRDGVPRHIYGSDDVSVVRPLACVLLYWTLPPEIAFEELDAVEPPETLTEVRSSSILFRGVLLRGAGDAG